MEESYNHFPIHRKVKHEVDELLTKMKGYVFKEPQSFPNLNREHIKDLEVLYFFDCIEEEKQSDTMQRIEDEYLLEYQRLGDIQAYIIMYREGLHTRQDLAELDRIAREENN